ncbi:MAG: hypothetical protein ACYCW6_12720, partial [Candidatus Xenobia bacterium]
QRWTAPQELRELIDVPLTSLEQYIPSFRYYSVAENEFSADTLVALDNLVAGVFLLESSDITELHDTLERIRCIYQKEINPELRREFTQWLRRALERRGFAMDLETLSGEETRKMLDTKFDEYDRKRRNEGQIEGLRRSLRLILESRFGEDANKVTKHVEVITDSEQLESLVRLASRATSLVEVESHWPAA